MTEAVELRASDGAVLRGELRRGGETWVVLAHDDGEDLDHWGALAPGLARQGLTVLAVDLRGHGGSEGEPDPTRTAADLADVFEFAREAGARLVVVVAAGATVPPALEAAAETGVSGVVAIAPRGDVSGPCPAAKLAVVAVQDPAQSEAASALRRTPGSAVVVSLPLDGGCAELVAGAWRTNVEAYVLAFAREAARRARASA
jgi:alpha-beta hydrolase superfamily lysophospholipase